MPFDGMLLHRTLEELKKFEGARIGKIQSLSDEEVLFYLHKAGSRPSRLAISTHSNTCRIYESRHAEDIQPNPTPFVMLLRKRISQGIITSITQAGYDRIVEIRIQAYDEIGDRRDYLLMAELMGKYANLILVDPSGMTIIDCLKRIPVYENSKRLIHPGAIYALPEKPNRQNPQRVKDLNTDLSLVKQIEGFSPSLSREFLFRMKNGQYYYDILNELNTSKTLYSYPKDFHCLELTHLGKPEETKALMEGLETLFEADEKKRRIALQCGDVFKAAAREEKKLAKKLPKLQASLADSQDYDQYREYGDVLFAHLYLEKKPVMELPSFEQEGKILSIPIDMRYSLKDNANLFYKKYHKLKRGVAILQEQVQECADQLEYFQTLCEQLNYCSADDVLEIRQELADRHIVRLKKDPSRRKKKSKPHVTRIEMKDAVIYAGKNNLQNHYLTWTLGRRGDLWFHVKDYHGSHVILQSEHPTEEQIRFAAMVAAWFSKGRNSSSVPIDYTTISQLKKVPGKGPGFVTMKSYQTIYIDPDPERIEKALQTGKVDE